LRSGSPRRPTTTLFLFHAVVTRDKVLKIIEAGVALDSVAVSPDGKRIVSGHRDGSVRLWDATTCRPIGEPMTGHEDGVNSVAFSPDGGRVVSGGSDATVRIWDATTGKPVGQPLTGRDKTVSGLAFSPGGQRIASGGWDSTLRLWDAATGQPIGTPMVTEPLPSSPTARFGCGRTKPARRSANPSWSRGT
jgi:WD40 repeat protein